MLKVGNAALRFKPTEGSPLAELQPQGMPAGGQGGSRGPGAGDDLRQLAASLGLNAAQQAAFDKALQEMQQRQAERAAQMQAAAKQQGQNGGSRLFGGGMRFGGPGGGGGDASMMAQLRARMRDRMNQQFAPFVASLDEAQRGKWNAGLDAQLSAKRVTAYKLVDGKPQPVLLKVGASDGSSTEISGRDIKEGDQIVSGERAGAETK